MPTYEYRCDHCGVEFERVQRITDDRLRKCPECGKMKLVRLVGTGNFILKGSGWYKDLYSSVPKDKKKSDDSGSKESGSGDKSSDKNKAAGTSESKGKADKSKGKPKASGE